MSDDGRGETQRVRIRRAPKLGVFIGLGIALGIIASLILTSSQPVDEKVGFAATAGYFALYGIAGGALVGALVGVILDAVLRRRSREAVVTRDRVSSEGAPDAEVGSDPAPADPSAADPNPDGPSPDDPNPGEPAPGA